MDGVGFKLMTHHLPLLFNAVAFEVGIWYQSENCLSKVTPFGNKCTDPSFEARCEHSSLETIDLTSQQAQKMKRLTIWILLLFVGSSLAKNDSHGEHYPPCSTHPAPCNPRFRIDAEFGMSMNQVMSTIISKYESVVSVIWLLQIC